MNSSGARQRRQPRRPEGGPMAHYKVLIEVWCDWDPEDSALEDWRGCYLYSAGSRQGRRSSARHRQRGSDELLRRAGGRCRRKPGVDRRYRGGRRFCCRWRPNKEMSLRKACLFSSRVSKTTLLSPDILMGG